MKKILILLLITLGSIFAEACKYDLRNAEIYNSGKLLTEERSTNNFSAISLECSANIEIKTSEKYKVKVIAEKNILPLIITKIKGKTLVITTKDDCSFSSKKKVLVSIEMPSPEKLNIEGSGDILLYGLNSKDFTCTIQGSGDIKVDGKAENINFYIEGSGNIDAKKLKAQKAKVEINGSGDVTLDAAKRLIAEINGSGDIIYYGNPQLESNVSGSGELIKK